MVVVVGVLPPYYIPLIAAAAAAAGGIGHVEAFVDELYVRDLMSNLDLDLLLLPPHLRQEYDDCNVCSWEDGGGA